MRLLRTRRGAFFGRRKGHKLRPGQTRLMTEVLPALALDLTKPASNLRALFPLPVDAVRLEIGFGGGEHLLHEARQNPATGFIGCEPYQNGMARALAVIEAENLEEHPPALRRRARPDRLAAGGVARAHRYSLSRSLAQAAPLEAPLHLRSTGRTDDENSGARRRDSLRQRHRKLRGMGAAALAARAGSDLDRRTGRRLALALGGFSEHSLRDKSIERRQEAYLSTLSAPIRALRHSRPALYSQNKNVHLNAILGSNVESGPRPGPALFC